MKSIISMPFIALVLLWGGCTKEVVKEEKLVFSETEIPKCECPDKTNVCWYDTVKTLMIIRNVSAVLKTDYWDESRINGILIDNAKSYISGPYDFREPFYFWWVMNGMTIPCNMPDEILTNKKYAERKVIVDCLVRVFPLPLPNHSYPRTDGYPIKILKMEILKE